MSKTALSLFKEGHRKLVCVDNHGCYWWTEGKVYEFNSDDFLVDDDGHYSTAGEVKFEPYSFFGMTNKEFAPEDIDKIAAAVAEKVIAMMKEKTNAL